MIVNITPRKLHGEVDAIASKSYAHRILIASALADKPCNIHINTNSVDIKTTIECLRVIKSGIKSPQFACHESGSTARFLLPVAAAVCDEFTMTGTGRLPERPMQPIIEPMSQNGCTFDNNKLPLHVSGRLQSGVYHVAGNISSQFISGLLLALPLLDGDSKIILTAPLESASYVDITLDVLSMFGIVIEHQTGKYLIQGNQHYISPDEITVPRDWSNAAFYHTMNILGSKINIHGLDGNSKQGDRAIGSILQSLPNTCLDMSQVPDLVPVVAVAASLTLGKTVITGTSRLKLKESDRVQTSYDMLTALGADIKLKEDGFEIHGKKSLRGGVVDANNDHRIAMAAAVAATGCDENVTIHDAQAVNKSYPEFFNHYVELGGKIDVVNDG